MFLKLFFFLRKTLVHYEYKVATNKIDVNSSRKYLKERGLKKSGVLSQLLRNGKL